MQKPISDRNMLLPAKLTSSPTHSPRRTASARTTLCGRLGQALRSDAYVGFREGQLTLVNHSRS